MKIHFSVSDAQLEPHPETGEPPIKDGTDMTVECDEFVQLTYAELRVGPHGDELARLDPETGFWLCQGREFTDIVIVGDL